MIEDTRIDQPGALAEPNARMLGTIAYGAGTAYEDCPHPVALRPFSRKEWQEGWLTAKRVADGD